MFKKLTKLFSFVEKCNNVKKELYYVVFSSNSTAIVKIPSISPARSPLDTNVEKINIIIVSKFCKRKTFSRYVTEHHKESVPLYASFQMS